jgi:hypothetical protein
MVIEHMSPLCVIKGEMPLENVSPMMARSEEMYVLQNMSFEFTNQKLRLLSPISYDIFDNMPYHISNWLHALFSNYLTIEDFC